MICSEIPTILTNRLKLEKISSQHCTYKYVNWLNDEEIYKYLDTGGNVTYDDLLLYLSEFEKKPAFFWAIKLKDTNCHIGNIKVDPINTRNQIGEYGILMGDKSKWGLGYAREASEAIISFCFKELNLRKISLGVVEDNINAVKLYKTLGFIIEGTYLLHGEYSGKYCNVYRMSLFNRSYPEFESLHQLS